MVTQKSTSHLSRQADGAYPNISDKLAYSINEACAATGIGRTSLYELISNGQLKAIKAAGRRLICGPISKPIWLPAAMLPPEKQRAPGEGRPSNSINNLRQLKSAASALPLSRQGRQNDLFTLCDRVPGMARSQLACSDRKAPRRKELVSLVQPAPGAWLPARLGEKFYCLQRRRSAGLQWAGRDRYRHRRFNTHPLNHRGVAPNTGSEAWSAGFTAFFRDPTGNIETARLSLVEILARGTQTVLPPSIHPDTGKPFIWLDTGELTAGRYIPLVGLPDLSVVATIATDDVGGLHRIVAKRTGQPGMPRRLPVQYQAPLSRNRNANGNGGISSRHIAAISPCSPPCCRIAGEIGLLFGSYVGSHAGRTRALSRLIA